MFSELDAHLLPHGAAEGAGEEIYLFLPLCFVWTVPMLYVFANGTFFPTLKKLWVGKFW